MRFVHGKKALSVFRKGRLEMHGRKRHSKKLKEDRTLFPTGSLASSDIALLTYYLAVLGALLLAGVILRTKLKFLKKIYMPASLIAGVIGVILGQNCLGFFPADMTSTFAALPGSLIVVVFAPMLMCADFGDIHGLKGAKNLAIPQLIVGSIGSFIQIAIPCLLTVVLLGPVFHVNELFPSIVEVGWAGGHGTAGGMAEVYENLGWTEGTSLAITSATTGLLFGIIGGMIMINHGARKGYLSPKNRAEELNLKEQPDFTDKSAQKANAYETVHNNVVESFAFHVALIGLAILLGYVILYVLGFLVDGLPLFPMAMLGGFILNRILTPLGLMKYVDQHTLQRIQGVCLDILVVAAVSSINLAVILDNIIPILLVSAVAGISMLVYFYGICPRMFNEDWFEQGIVHFGVNTGVTAVGFMLLRAVDPEMNTLGSKGYAIQAPFTSPLFGGGLVTSLTPVLIATYGNLKVGLVSLAIIVVLLLIGILCGCWHKPLRYTK